MKHKQPNLEHLNSSQTQRIYSEIAAALPEQQPDHLKMMRHNMLQRVAQHRQQHQAASVCHYQDYVWQTRDSGQKFTMLRRGVQDQSILLYMPAGSVLTPHEHSIDEECVVLSGKIYCATLQTELNAGDYHLAPQGSFHPAIEAIEDTYLYLNGDFSHQVSEATKMTAKSKQVEVRSDFIDGGEWQILNAQVSYKTVYQTSDAQSCLYRFNGQSAWILPCSSGGFEALVVQGDVFYDDLLLQAQDFYTTPTLRHSPKIHTEGAGLLFVKHYVSDFFVGVA